MASSSTGNLFLAGTFALVTALFWGSYGPLLHKGSQFMGPFAPPDPTLGRMRPFLCVGLAYFIIAIVAPIIVMQFMGTENKAGISTGWTMKGVLWSFAGGAVGALGAFALIMALNNGTPVQVMPLVFGIAPVISVAVSMYMHKTYAQVSPYFFVGMILVILGAVTILLTAPKPHHGKKPTADVATTSAAATTNPLTDNEKK